MRAVLVVHVLVLLKILAQSLQLGTVFFRSGPSLGADGHAQLLLADQNEIAIGVHPKIPNGTLVVRANDGTDDEAWRDQLTALVTSKNTLIRRRHIHLDRVELVAARLVLRTG